MYYEDDIVECVGTFDPQSLAAIELKSLGAEVPVKGQLFTVRKRWKFINGLRIEFHEMPSKVVFWPVDFKLVQSNYKGYKILNQIQSLIKN